MRIYEENEVTAKHGIRGEVRALLTGWGRWRREHWRQAGLGYTKPQAPSGVDIDLSEEMEALNQYMVSDVAKHHVRTFQVLNKIYVSRRTTAQVAIQMGISERTVRRLRMAGEDLVAGRWLKLGAAA